MPTGRGECPPFLFFYVRRLVLCLKICGQKTLLDRVELPRFFDEEGLVARKRGHTGGAIAFLWWAVLSARRPVLCLKICGLKTLLDRGELSRFFDEEGFVARKRGHTGGWEAIAFLWWTVLSARRPAPCLKICGLSTLLDGELQSLFLFMLCVVLRALTYREIT